MKILFFLVTVLSVVLATEILDVNSLNIKNLKISLDEDFVRGFLDKYEEQGQQSVSAIINDYADKLLKNIEKFIIEDNLDPLAISDIKEEFLTASITLTNGNLNGISTASRSGDVKLSYSSDNQILDLDLPIIFSNLNFTFDYHVIILLIGPKGSIVGEINDFKMDLKVQFDFNTYHGAIEEISTSNEGHINLTFHGNGVIDEVVDVLTKFVTTVLHPLISSIIEKFVNEKAVLVINAINDAIDNFLNPGTTPVANFV